MKKISVFITTNYFCNFDCEYCYLGYLRNDTKVIDAIRLKKQLDEISASRKIEEIIIAGGETTLLPLDLPQTISHICRSYTDSVNFVTNFVNDETARAISEITGNISVSINKERPNYEGTIQKVLSSELDNISLSIVVTPSVLAMDKEKMMTELEILKRPILFLQYSPSIYNEVVYPISNRDYEDFLHGFIIEYFKEPRSFELINLEGIEGCITKKEEPWQDSVVFIDPYNKYTALEYIDGREYFKEFKDIREIEESSGQQEAYFSSKCDGCRYFGHCYAEHMKDWKSDDSCCGMKGLIEWYEKDIYKNDRGLQSML